MKIINTKDPQQKPPLVMLVYGEGGVGKTTFATTAKKPLMIDLEGGTKYLGLRDIAVDTVHASTFKESIEAMKYAVSEDYDTVVIDPLGELVEKAKQEMIYSGNSKFVQKDGSPTMAGWGKLKDNLRSAIKFIKGSGKHVILIAHVEEKEDEQRLVKRPMVQTKLSEEVVNMVDVVGYMTIIQIKNEDGDLEPKRVIMVDPESDKFVAKDRSEQLGKYVNPDFQRMVEMCAGSDFKWDEKIEGKETPEVKADSPDEKSDSIEDKLNSKSNDELKEILKGANLKVSGNKKELVDRIIKNSKKSEKKEESSIVKNKSEAKTKLQEKINDI